MSNYKYRLYGLNFCSDFRLRMLPQYECDNYDVSIRSGSIPNHLPLVLDSGGTFEAAPNDFLFKLSHFSVTFRVQTGNFITVDIGNGVFREEHELFLLTSVMGALLLQRNILPIHGCAISTKKGAYIFAGKSSSGKSTLAAEFYTNGYQIIADDISAIGYSSDNRMIVNLSVPYLKIWQDVLEHYDLMGGLKRIRPDLNKYFLPIKHKVENQSYGIAAIIVLSTHNSHDFKLTKLSGIRSIEYLRLNTYRYKFIKGLNKVETHFNLMSKIATQYDLYLLERPKYPLLIKELREFIELELINRYE